MPLLKVSAKGFFKLNTSIRMPSVHSHFSGTSDLLLLELLGRFAFSRHVWPFFCDGPRSLRSLLCSGDLFLLKLFCRFAFSRHAWPFSRRGPRSLRSLCRSGDLLLLKLFCRFAKKRTKKDEANDDVFPGIWFSCNKIFCDRFFLQIDFPTIWFSCK